MYGSVENVGVGKGPYVGRVFVGCHRVAEGVADKPQEEGQQRKHSSRKPKGGGSTVLQAVILEGVVLATHHSIGDIILIQALPISAE